MNLKLVPGLISRLGVRGRWITMLLRKLTTNYNTSITDIWLIPDIHIYGVQIS